MKCNGRTSGCQQCAHLNLRCVYKAADATAKSRVKAGRGSVLARLKGGQQASNKANDLLPAAAGTSLTAQAAGWGERAGAGGVEGDNGDSAAGVSQTPSSIGAPGGFSSSEFPQSFFTALVDPYDEYIYCVSPVVTAAEIRAAIANMHHDPYDFMLVHAFGAVTVNLTQPKWTYDPLEEARLKRLLDIAMSARGMLSTACFVSGGGGGGGGGAGTVKSGVRPMLAESFIMATIFIEMSLMAFRRHDEAFLMLREAISLIQILQMEKTRHAVVDDGTAAGPRSPEQTAHAVQQRAAEARWQRLYWEAFIHERFSAIVDFRPIVLEPLRDSVAAEDETLPVQIREWFRGIVQMFSVIDHEFVRYWLGTSPGSGPGGRAAAATDEGSDGKGQQQLVREWIERKKKQLDNLEFMVQRTVDPSSVLPQQHHHQHHTSPPAFRDPQHSYDSTSPRSTMYHEMDLHHLSMSAASPASTIGSSIYGNSLATENWPSLTTVQQADLVITRQWMLTLLWQLALSHCVLTSSSSSSTTAAASAAGGSTTATTTTQKVNEDRQVQGHPSSPERTAATTTGQPPATAAAGTTTSGETDDSATSTMSLSFPVRLSQQLRALILQLGRRPIERHGSGIRQKLFEITTTFADVIVVCTTAEAGLLQQSQAAEGGETHPLQLQQQQRFDDFAFLYEFLRDFAGLDEVQARILGDKAELVRGVQRGR